jgi:hypothetical protein
MMTKSDLVRRDVCRTESAVAIVVEFIFACDGCAAKVTTASRHAGRARNQLEGWISRKGTGKGHETSRDTFKKFACIPETPLGVGYTKDRTGLPLEALRTPLPQPGADQVLIRVAAAVGVSPDDLMITLYEAKFSHLAGRGSARQRCSARTKTSKG